MLKGVGIVDMLSSMVPNEFGLRRKSGPNLMACVRNLGLFFGRWSLRPILDAVTVVVYTKVQFLTEPITIFCIYCFIHFR